MIYFMMDKNGKLGHPTRRNDMITRKLKNGTAKIVSRTKDSLTVKFLDKEFKDEDTVDAEYRVGLDPGITHVGFALYKIFKEKITLLISGEAEIRSTDVSKSLKKRREKHRGLRRYYRRKNTIRKFGKCKTRISKYLRKKITNRKLRPTHRHLIDTHTQTIKWFLKRIPINKIHVEYAKFDTQKMQNINIKPWQYQLGPQYAFENIKSYVRYRDNYTCQNCGNTQGVLEVHHKKSRSQGGSDRPSNLITLGRDCGCHGKADQGLIIFDDNLSDEINLKEAGVLNTCMPSIFQIFSNRFPTQDTYGHIIKTVRLNSNLDKTHEQDAQIIAFCDSLGLQDISDYNYLDLGNHISIKQFKRHDRVWMSNLESRKYYIAGQGKKIFAKNRRRATAQKDRGFDELKTELKNLGIFNKVQIYVKPGGPTYKKSVKDYPIRRGDLVKYNNDVHICKNIQNYGKVLILDGVSGTVGIKKCQLIRRNSGLVCV